MKLYTFNYFLIAITTFNLPILNASSTKHVQLEALRTDLSIRLDSLPPSILIESSPLSISSLQLKVLNEDEVEEESISNGLLSASNIDIEISPVTSSNLLVESSISSPSFDHSSPKLSKDRSPNLLIPNALIPSIKPITLPSQSNLENFIFQQRNLFGNSPKAGFKIYVKRKGSGGGGGKGGGSKGSSGSLSSSSVSSSGSSTSGSKGSGSTDSTGSSSSGSIGSIGSLGSSSSSGGNYGSYGSYGIYGYPYGTIAGGVRSGSERVACVGYWWIGVVIIAGLDLIL